MRQWMLIFLTALSLTGCGDMVGMEREYEEYTGSDYCLLSYRTKNPMGPFSGLKSVDQIDGRYTFGLAMTQQKITPNRVSPGKHTVFIDHMFAGDVEVQKTMTLDMNPLHHYIIMLSDDASTTIETLKINNPKALEDLPKEKQTSPPPQPPTPPSPPPVTDQEPSDRATLRKLEELKIMLDRGLITQKDYDDTKKKLLKKMTQDD